MKIIPEENCICLNSFFAPAAAWAADIVDIGAPEATPLIQARMFEPLDESHYLSPRAAANIASEMETESNNYGTALGVAIPCVAAAVGVAGFVAYRRQRSAIDATLQA